MAIPAFARRILPTYVVIAIFFLPTATIAASTISDTPVDETILRIARSKDGVSFKDDGHIFLRGASAPTIAQLRNGHLVVMVDYALNNEKDQTRLSVTRSNDGGKTWSPLRHANIHAPDAVRLTASNASLARTPGGRLHVFFASTPVRKRKSSPIMVFSATTRNGLDFRVDRSMRLGLPNSSEAHPMAIATNGRLHLLIERIAKGRKQRSDAPILEHFVSPDGSDFARLAPTRFEDLRFVGDVVACADGYRAYVTAPAGVTSLVSKNLRKWKREKGLRIARGFDPAVTKLSDGTFLMIYCAKTKDESGGRTSVVDIATYGDDFDANDWIVEAELPKENEFADASPDRDPDNDTNTNDQSAEAQGADQVDAIDDTSVESATKDWVVDPAHKDDWWDYWDPDETGGFAPPPDFKTKVDYFSWYKDYLLPLPDDNAYDAYAKFMPGLYPNGPPELPMVEDMYTEDNLPGPWKPEDHPNWAESNDKIQNLLDQFREASKILDYAVPTHTSLDFKDEKSDEERLLMGILLPNLSSHRSMTKWTIADAWRVGKDGKVSPKKMSRAIETVLRASGHMEQGQTLIEEMVATAQRHLIRDTARRALANDVFSAEEIENVLDTLQTLDQPLADPARGARMEHGFSMDITQHLFSPPTDDGQPKFNRERAARVAPFSGKDEKWVEEMSKMTSDDVYASLDAFNRHYQEFTEQIHVGYPDVRVADLVALEAESVHTSPLTEAMLPAFSRYYQLKTRGEASRRATQLSFAVQLFKKQNGRWPASLDELPTRYSPDVRTDPFTGDDFKYELTDSGPRIYSLSENATDDGGKHSRRWDDNTDQSDGSDDYVFWPPQLNK
jgi:hypothetical protein